MIVYVHGFGSAGGGNKYTTLKCMFPSFNVISPTYDCTDFSSIEQLMDEYDLEKEERLLFIGNSLGGYIAMYLAKKYNGKAILLNPLTNINSLNEFLGQNINLATEEIFYLTEENIKKLESYKVDYNTIPLSVFVTKDDDVIDYNETIKYFKNRNVTVFENGTHRFTNLIDIKDKILIEYFNIIL